MTTPDGGDDNRPRAVVVDDHHAVRLAVTAVLEDEFSVAATGSSGAESVALCRLWRPEVLVLDQRLPDGAGSRFQPQIQRCSPRTRTVLYTALHDADTRRDVAVAGVSAIVRKTSNASILLHAVRAAVRGERFVDPSFDAAFATAFLAGRPYRPFGLTDQELEILRRVAGGCTNVCIAEQLVLSPETIKTHVSRLLRKLAARQRSHAVAIAVTSGLAPLEPSAPCCGRRAVGRRRPPRSGGTARTG